MRYAQTQLTEKDFVAVKKAALDSKLSLGEFLKKAVLWYIKEKAKKLTES